MVTTFLIISFLLVLISFATYRWLLPKPNHLNENILPPAPPDFKGLFAPDEKALADIRKAETEARVEKHRHEILRRAENRMRESLMEAKTFADREFYNQVLDIFVQNAKTSEELQSLVSFIANEKALRSNSSLARKCLEEFRGNPNKASFVQALHIAALSDNAAFFQETVETVAILWQEEKLSGVVTEEEIRVAAESEFWILSQEARNSGAGFLLKQMLSDLKNKLKKN